MRMLHHDHGTALCGPHYATSTRITAPHPVHTSRPASLHLHTMPSPLPARFHTRSGLFRRRERVAGVESDRRPWVLLVGRVFHDRWYSLRLECAVVASAWALTPV
jgi:hypothetical protein